MKLRSSGAVAALTALFLPGAGTVLAGDRPARTASLIGTAEAINDENRRADGYRLERYRDRDRLKRAVDEAELVPIGDTASYYIDEELGEEDPDRAELYVHARPWVKRFLDQFLARAHSELGFRFAVTSLVRPKSYQRRLRRTNGAAADESTHATGSTVDIAMAGLSWAQKQRLRKMLLELESRGLVLATEEPRIGCFHIFVSPDFKNLDPVCSPDDDGGR